MSRITLTPFCVSRTKDKDALIKTRAIFKSPLAIMFGLRAVVQGYVINTGQVSMDRKPVLLLRDTETGEDALLDGSQINPCNGMTRQQAEELSPIRHAECQLASALADCHSQPGHHAGPRHRSGAAHSRADLE